MNKIESLVVKGLTGVIGAYRNKVGGVTSKAFGRDLESGGLKGEWTGIGLSVMKQEKGSCVIRPRRK
jgi:hypothetical protein